MDGGDAMPKTMTKERAAAAMSALLAGRSRRSITTGDRFGTSIATPTAFRNYCSANPEYAEEANKLIEKNNIASNIRKGDRFKNRTHCKHGHSLRDAYSFVRSSDGYRVTQCATCQKIKIGAPINPEIKEKVEALIKKGQPFASFVTGGKPGRLISHKTLVRWRNEDKGFNRLIEIHAALRLQKKIERRVLTRKRGIVREQTNDYHRIRAMVGEYFPGRDDVISNIFEALLNKTLQRADIPADIKRLKAEHNRLYPTKYRKFGDAKLISLDELVFEDGATTIGDQVSRGLWA
jgi:hypothetical protein